MVGAVSKYEAAPLFLILMDLPLFQLKNITMPHFCFRKKWSFMDSTIYNEFNSNFIKKIDENQLISPEQSIIVALSGGIDSVALLLFLHTLASKYNLNLWPIYIHHHLRQEADSDVELCQQLCDRLNLVLKVVHVDVLNYVELEKCSEEEAGRTLRYEAFEAYLTEKSASSIAVAHHIDDQCETILHRLLRGSGLLGLTGMKPRNGQIIRPLLDFTKEELREYVLAHDENFVEDHTNLDVSYTRNRIRHELIPYLKEKFNPNITQTLNRLSHIVSEDDDFIEVESRLAFQKVVTMSEHRGQKLIQFKINELCQLHIALQRRVIKECVSILKGNSKNIEFNHLQRVIELMGQASGKRVDIVEGIIAIKEFEQIKIMYHAQLLESYIGFAQTLDMKTDKGYIQSAKIAYATYYYSINNYKDSFKISKNAYTKSFDCDRIENTLTLRTRQSGDFIHINQEGQTKTLKKFFVDEKIPLSIRDSIPLVAMDNCILWVVGYRINPIFEAAPASKKIFVVELTKEEVNGNN